MKTSARIGEDGFAELQVSTKDLPGLLELMKSRIRRLSHLEKAGPEEFADVSRLSRVCYALTSSPGSSTVPSLSREDVDALYVMPVEESVLNALNSVRGRARRGGPVDPVVADRMAKSVMAIMED